MKIIIIEDNLRHWEYIMYMLTKGDFTFYPSNLSDFKLIRKNINMLYSPREDVSHSAKEYLTMILNSGDFLLLDYQLSERYETINCIELYDKLGLDKKSLIYTKYTSHNYEKILADLKRKSFNDRIKVIQKPADLKDTYTLDETIKYLISNIKEANLDIVNKLPKLDSSK